MVHRRDQNRQRDLKTVNFDKHQQFKKNKHTVSLKVLDVTYLFHLRLDFFVKELKMRETEWHLERLKALINADMTETV